MPGVDVRQNAWADIQNIYIIFFFKLENIKLYDVTIYSTERHLLTYTYHCHILPETPNSNHFGIEHCMKSVPRQQLFYFGTPKGHPDASRSRQLLLGLKEHMSKNILDGAIMRALAGNFSKVYIRLDADVNF